MIVSIEQVALIRSLPWRPAACTMDAISAEDNRSGRETSKEEVSSLQIRRANKPTVLQIDIRAKVHLTGDSLENKSFFASRWERKFYLSV